MNTYKIVFKGKIAPGKDQSKLSVALARLLKLPESKAHLLFDGRSYAIKKNLELEKARYIQKKLNAAGIFTECKAEKSHYKSTKIPPKLSETNIITNVEGESSLDNSAERNSVINSSGEEKQQDKAIPKVEDVSQKQDKSAIEGLRALFYLSIFTSLFFLSGTGEQAFAITIVTTMFLSVIYFAYYIFTENKLSEMLKGVVLSVLLLMICTAIPILFPILIVYTLYQLKYLWGTFKSLNGQSVFFVIFWGVLYLYHYYIESSIGKYALAGLYFLIVFGYSGLLIESRLKDSLMKFSVMMLSMPLSMILLTSIASGIRNLFQTTITSVVKPVTSTQVVSSHMRGDTFINSYSREVTKEVSSAVTTTSIGSGSAIIGSTNSVAKAVSPEAEKKV
ncbi:hypothetical protein [Pseudoalteromonas piscicida]|uniref:hypothetical protein n=1 Tax=Pseudoalteromonas piscicida TaxID=43662 RepID=UPI0030A76619